MMQVSIAGFATGGAFLSLVNFDVPYYLMAALGVAFVLAYQELQHAAAPAPTSAIQSTPLGDIRAELPPTARRG